MAALHQRDEPFFTGLHSTFITEIPTPTSTVYRAQQTNPSYYNSDPNNNNDENWGGTKFVASIIPIGFFALIIFGIWYCCCGGRAKRRQRHLNRHPVPGPNPHPQPHQGFQTRAVELTPVPAAHLANGDLPPPRYEEAVPPRHQTIAGGVTHVRQEEEGIISDGKTPLSEIPFEDVVVSSGASSGSGSSARNFGQSHHGGRGNTYGHTNS